MGLAAVQLDDALDERQAEPGRHRAIGFAHDSQPEPQTAPLVVLALERVEAVAGIACRRGELQGVPPRAAALHMELGDIEQGVFGTAFAQRTHGEQALAICRELGDKRAVRSANPRIKEFEASCFDGVYITGDVTADYLSQLANERDAAREIKS